jgi:uncharacterized phiE125 gp8 family phage protein
MSTILTTPPSVEPLSLTEAKAHLRITHNDDDTYISTLIISARRAVEQRFDICLLQQSWSVFVDEWPNLGEFKLPFFPVMSIADVKIYGDDDVAATLDPAHYYLDAVSRAARLVLRMGRIFPPPGRRANGIEIKVVTGFGAAAASVPNTIKQALLITLADWFANRGDEQGALLPVGALELLAPYRTVRVA